MAQKKILVVDDDEVIRRLVGKRLTDQGYEVALAATGAEARQKVEEGLPALILMDIMLPDMDGAEVVRLIHANPVASCVPVIFLSSIIAKEEGQKGSVVKVADATYEAIGKPVDMDLLMLKIKQLLGTKTS